MPKRPPRFYFSLRSPYSWLAYRELWEHHPDVACVLDWVPFFEPDAVSARLLAEAGGAEFPYSEMSRAKNLYVLQDIGRITKARGIAVTWPVDRAPVWEVPHLGYLVAARYGKGQPYIGGVYAARFGEGRDICDPATVADVARSIGLDPDEVTGAAADPFWRAEGVRSLVEVCTDGVFGVPYMVQGLARYWGVDRLPGFVDRVRAAVIDTAQAEPPAGVVGLGRSADDGHAGGCG